MIIDCHTHLNNYTNKPVLTRENLKALLTRIERYRMDHALVLTSYFVNEDRPGVADVVELCRPHKRISIVEGITFQDGRPADLSGTRARLERKEIVGLKMYPGYVHFYPNDRVCEPVYELAQEFGVPVMFHAGDTYARGAKVKYAHPIHLDDVAVDHPDMNMVVCHLGNPWFRDTAEVVYKNENAYADISGLVLEAFEAPLERWVAEEVREIITYSGDPDFLLYGTDWPIVRMGPYMQFVKSLGFEEKAMEKIMYRNAKRLFRLKVEAPTQRRKAGSRGSATFPPVVETGLPETGEAGEHAAGGRPP